MRKFPEFLLRVSLPLEVYEKIGDRSTYFTKQVIHSCRSPTLELAYQAQIAACNYLGYSPREFSASQFRQQMIPADYSRPLELHMHHHHHHYVASPTSPFSQTVNTAYYGEPEVVAPVADLSIRNPSQGLLRSQGHSETNQRSSSSCLWLKNQASEDEEEKPSSRYGQEIRGDSNVPKEGGLIVRDSRSHRDFDNEQQKRLDREMPGYRQTFATSRKVDVNTLRGSKGENDAERGGYQSPFGSQSDENLATEESVTPTIYESRPTSQRALQGVIDPWKPDCIHGTKAESGIIVTPSSLERNCSQVIQRPAPPGRLRTRHSSQRQSNSVYGERSGSNSTKYEDTNSSAGNDSTCGSEMASGILCNWACGSRPDKSQKKEPIRAARKNYGARASRRQASREARAWESKDRKTSRSFSHAEARDDEKNKHPCIYELDSQKEVVQKADLSRCDYENGGTRPEGEAFVEDVYHENDRRGTEKLKLEYLQDSVLGTPFYTPWTEQIKSIQNTSQNRFRQAVEAAWKTSLGTKSGPQSEDPSFEEVLGTGGASQDSPQEDLNSRIVSRVTAEKKVAEEDLRGLLDERALCHATCKEELEQGVTDRLRLQELLQLEKLKLEVTERELREVNRCFHETLVAETKVNKKNTSESRLEQQSKQTLINPADVGVRDDIHLKLISESEARIDAEAKASYFEASAKAAEEKIKSLLKERNSFDSRYKEEVERNSTDKRASQQSTELDDASPERTEQTQSQNMDFGDFVASGVNKPSDGAAQNGVHGKASVQAGLKQKSEQEDARRHRSHSLSEIEEARQGEVKEMVDRRSSSLTPAVFSKQKRLSNSAAEIRNELSEIEEGRQGEVKEMVDRRSSSLTQAVVSKQKRLSNSAAEIRNELSDIEEGRQGEVKEMVDRRSLSLTPAVISKQKRLSNSAAEIRNEHESEKTQPPFLATGGDNEKQLAGLNIENSNLKRDKKRLISPNSSSRVQRWTPDIPFSVRIERCSLEDGETTTIMDISPNFADSDQREISPSFSSFRLEADETIDTQSTNTSELSAELDSKVGDDEKLVSRRVRSYSYDMSDQLIEHPDMGREENEEAISQAETDLEQISTGRAVTIYQQSADDGTSTFEEEHSAFESESPKKHLYAREERTPRNKMHYKLFDAQKRHGPDKRGKYVKRGEDHPRMKDVEDDIDAFDHHLMLLPSKWKKAAKAELRKIIEEQELTWKIAEDAMAELSRRLELLERYKMGLQDNLGTSRATDIMDSSTIPEKKFESSPGGFSSLYHSPIYEDRVGILERETYGGISTQGDPSDNEVPARQQSNNVEIQKLKADIAELKSQLTRRSSRNSSPRMKEGFRYSSSSSPPTPPLPPPPATPATPPTPPVVPDFPINQKHAFQESSNKSDVSSFRGCENYWAGPDVEVGILEPEKLEAENVKIVTSQATDNGYFGHLGRNVDRQRDHEDSHSDEYLLESRSWVPIPDDDSVDKGCWIASNLYKNGDRNRWATGDKLSAVKSSRIRLPSRRGSRNDSTISCKLSSDEGELDVFKDAVRKLSNIFWEQEGKLKNFQGEVNMAEADPSHSLEMRSFYVDLLKEMSQQLGELCRDLHGDSSESINDRGTMVRPLVGISEVENLKAALEAAERHIEEEVNINRQLQEKLDAGDKHLCNVLENHAEELSRKEKTISFAQQINLQLSNEMSVTESSLAELRARYKGLVSNLESQLKEARHEVSGLQCTLSEFKLEVEKNQSLIQNLERAGQEKDSQIQELTRRMQAYQVETDQTSVEKLELLKNIQALRREADDQQRRIVELVKINEELLEFAQSKEDEVKGLKKEVSRLQQVSQGKSDEANGLAREASIALEELMDARKDGEGYRLRCMCLKTKLEETEQELMSREDALERLTGHLSSTIEGQDLISEEKEQLLLSLSKAQYKEHRMDDQVRQSKVIIQELEEKMSCMEEELCKARIAMTEMKVKDKEVLAIEKEAGEMRNRIHELEEEIMEKEGQISILKSSFRGEFDSAF
ncbi:hypothetical protein MPTK1_6g01700 [Marchantia polymorpha subsp. ruderalis]|uniref:Uncharacterized protein n=2 Tax=Marchantia polymorpha TaxID=3197 RepID=A0AAF6BMH9_MARPO|nr:hypothetical protein MARPO_0052s0034 [Marchantia polymorpha]BBN13213.1 hypothetical protein Mp_6g01700 [Marchantia polymorpha subsp. ruderalis]|eukprot:PTQ38233.1 hypothetical protein MARPO_0052s0034 [Marchantia polymorpha]